MILGFASVNTTAGFVIGPTYYGAFCPYDKWIFILWTVWVPHTNISYTGGTLFLKTELSLLAWF
jgi:hypothetical protein